MYNLYSVYCVVRKQQALHLILSKINLGIILGVDFQVKTMLVQNIVVSLQLWDTAGQER